MTKTKEMERGRCGPRRKVRYAHIFLLKIVSLFGMIFYHSARPYGRPALFWEIYADIQSDWMTDFLNFLDVLLIPSFVFASGFLYVHTSNRPFFTNLKNRIFRLVLPWFLTTVLWLVPLYFYFKVPSFNRPADLPLFDTYKLAFSGLFFDYLWFLPILFWSTLFWMVINPIFRKINHVWRFPVAFFGAWACFRFGQDVPWYGISRVAPFIILFYFGMVANTYRGIVEASAKYWFIPALILIAFEQYRFFKPTAMTFFSAVLCSFVLYMICYKICASIRANRLLRIPFFRYCEKNMYLFYLLHMPGSIVLFRYFYAINPSPWFTITLGFLTNIGVTAVLVVILDLLAKPFTRKVKPLTK